MSRAGHSYFTLFSVMFWISNSNWCVCQLCISAIACSTYLILYRHHQYASNFEQYFHVIFMVLLHSSTTINAIILMAVCWDFKAIPHHKGRFTEFKPVKNNQHIKYSQGKHVYHSVSFTATFVNSDRNKQGYISVFTYPLQPWSFLNNSWVRMQMSESAVIEL